MYKVASRNYAYSQFWSQHSSVSPKHSKNPHPLPAKDVDGSLVTRASQDRFVGFHHLTYVVLEHELCVEFTLTVAIRLFFLVVLSKVSLESICISENFATI